MGPYNSYYLAMSVTTLYCLSPDFFVLKDTFWLETPFLDLDTLYLSARYSFFLETPFLRDSKFR